MRTSNLPMLVLFLVMIFLEVYPVVFWLPDSYRDLSSEEDSSRSSLPLPPTTSISEDEHLPDGRKQVTVRIFENLGVSARLRASRFRPLSFPDPTDRVEDLYRHLRALRAMLLITLVGFGTIMSVFSLRDRFTMEAVVHFLEALVDLQVDLHN